MTYPLQGRSATGPIKNLLFALALGLVAFAFVDTAASDVILAADFEQPRPVANPLDPMVQVGSPSERAETLWGISEMTIGSFSNAEACNVGNVGLGASFPPVPVEDITQATFELTHPNAPIAAGVPVFMDVELNFEGMTVGVAVTSSNGAQHTVDLLSAIQAQTGKRLSGIVLNGHYVASAPESSVTCVDNISITAVPEPATLIHLSMLLCLVSVMLSKQPFMIGWLKHNSLLR